MNRAGKPIRVRRRGVIAVVVVALCGVVVLASAYAIGRQTVAEPTNESVAHFVGTWRVHGETLEIRPDLTGVAIRNAGPCEGGGTTEGLCTAYETVWLAPVDDHLAGVVVAAAVEDSTGTQMPDRLADSGSPAVGHGITLTWIDLDVLERSYDPPIPDGNPYLCGPQATEEWRTICNV